MQNTMGLIFAGVLCCSACSGMGEGIYHEGWIDRNKNGEKDPYENAELPIERRVADLLARMTIEEKTCRMGTIYGYKRVLNETHPSPEWERRVWKDGVANIDEHANGVRGVNEMTGLVEHGELLNEIQRWFAEETLTRAVNRPFRSATKPAEAATARPTTASLSWWSGRSAVCSRPV